MVEMKLFVIMFLGFRLGFLVKILFELLGGEIGIMKGLFGILIFL